jgi:hypothetical protein
MFRHIDVGIAYPRLFVGALPKYEGRIHIGSGPVAGRVRGPGLHSYATTTPLNHHLGTT